MMSMIQWMAPEAFREVYRSGEHDDRHGVALLADLRAEVAAVAVWQADVEQDRIEAGVGAVKVLAGFGQGRGLDHVEQPAGHQLLGQHLAQRVVVLNDNCICRSRRRVVWCDTSARLLR